MKYAQKKRVFYLERVFLLSNFKIITETNTDLPQKMIDELGIHAIPMLFTQCDKEYLNYADGRELDHLEFYKKLKEGHMSTTAQIPMAAFRDYLTPYLDEGMDVLYLGFSSGLSGTFSSCSIVAEELREDYPDRKIIMVDTLCASMGEGLIVTYAVNKQKEGASIEEVAKWVEDNKQKVAHYFTVEDLHHLKRGGRLSGTSAAIGSVMNIKPILRVNEEGGLVPCGKVRGRKQSLDFLAKTVVEKAVNIQDEYVYICHANCEEDAKYIIECIERDGKPKGVVSSMIGPVIGGHAGQGAIGVFFIADSRE